MNGLEILFLVHIMFLVHIIIHLAGRNGDSPRKMYSENMSSSELYDEKINEKVSHACGFTLTEICIC